MELTTIAERLRRIQESFAPAHVACPDCDLEFPVSDPGPTGDALETLILEIEIAERRQREKASA
jgi:hypothetical protein